MLNIFNLIKLLFNPEKKFFFDLKKIIGFCPGDLKYYKKAFLHRSASITELDGKVINNERLEFLGDAVLSSIVAEYLFKRFPDRKEGFLTQMRSKVVNRANINDLAERIGLQKFIVSNLQDTSGTGIFGDAFEALVGAIYMDKGYKRARRFVFDLIEKNFIDLKQLEATETNFKSKLIEWGQKNKKEISYITKELQEVSTKAVIFISQVKIDNELFGEGMGKNKKEAEKNAAQKSLESIAERDLH